MADPIVECPNCGRRNRVPSTASGVPRCGNCHRPLPWIAEAGDDTFASVVEQDRQRALLSVGGEVGVTGVDDPRQRVVALSAAGGARRGGGHPVATAAGRAGHDGG
jgi:hypothetical protein